MRLQEAQFALEMGKQVFHAASGAGRAAFVTE
jgi:hypothetical protein